MVGAQGQAKWAKIAKSPPLMICARMMAACKQHCGFGLPYLSDLGLHKIPCRTLLHCTEVLSFNYGLSVAKYRHRLSVMKNNIGIGPK